jgi:cell volume regulation protein A
MDAQDAILALALMLGAGLVARTVSVFTRVPELLLLIGAGAIVGPSALDWVDVPLGSEGAQVLFTLGVSFILFHGGFELSVRVLSRTVVGLGLLVVPGVIVTAAIVGAAAAALFGVDPLVGLLIGSALAPTDPAILIPLFERLGVHPKIGQTIVAESALNDPIGAVLALAIAGAITEGGGSVGHLARDFVVDIGLSTLLGVMFGIALALTLSSRRTGIFRESAAIAVILVVAAGYVSIDFAGGSGYLGAFIAGLLVGNMDELRHRLETDHERQIRELVGLIADVVVLLVFVLVGMNLPFALLRDEWLPALGVVAVLVLVARPLVVALCLVPDRRGAWTRRELAFVAWTRETGVIPAALAGVLVGKGVEGGDLVTVCVAMALVVTVSLQATTKPWLARRLGLAEEPSGPLVSVAEGKP